MGSLGNKLALFVRGYRLRRYCTAVGGERKQDLWEYLTSPESFSDRIAGRLRYRGEVDRQHEWPFSRGNAAANMAACRQQSLAIDRLREIGIAPSIKAALFITRHGMSG